MKPESTKRVREGKPDVAVAAGAEAMMKPRRRWWCAVGVMAVAVAAVVAAIARRAGNQQ